MNLLLLLEGAPYGRAARRPLREEQWSNVLAALLDPRYNVGPLQQLLTDALLSLSNIDEASRRVVSVERECFNGHSRRSDIVLSFDSGWKLRMEIKVDRNYEDTEQLWDEVAMLGPRDRFIFLTPRGISLLRAETRQLLCSDTCLSHVRWLDLASAWSNYLDETRPSGLDNLLSWLVDYWLKKEREDFVWQVEAIVEENAWSTFYSDTFKTAFCSRFPDVYQEWVDQNGERGLKGAHKLINTKLNGLTQRVPGKFRLVKTGNERAPFDPDWGHPILYEYRVDVE